MAKLQRNTSVGNRSFAGTYLGTLIIQVSTLLQSIITARLLGPTGRGELATILLWPLIIAGFGYPGFATFLARLAGRPETNLCDLQKRGLKIALLSSAVFVSVGYFLVPLFLSSEKAYLLQNTRLYLLWIPLNFVGLCFGSIDQGSGNFWLYNIPRVAMYPMSLMFFIIAYAYQIKNLTIIVIIIVLITLSVVLWRLSKTISDVVKDKSQAGLADLSKASIPYVSASLFDLLNKNMDKILLALLLAVSDMGYYVVAFSAASIHSTLSLSVAAVTFTKAAQSNENQQKFIARIFRYSVIMNSIFAAMLALVIYFAIPLVYGEPFKPSVKIAYVLLLGTSLSGLTEILDQFLRGMGKPLVGLSGRLISISCLLLLSVPLVPRFGAIGIAMSYAITQFVVMNLLVFTTISKYRIALADMWHIRSSDFTYLLNSTLSFTKLLFHRT